MSTEAKHTPGHLSQMPWHSGDGYSWGGDVIVSFGAIAINLGSGRNYVDLQNILSLGTLLAAAPELAEAGSDLIREFDNIYDVDDGRANIPGDLMALVDKLRAAIAKTERSAQ